MPKIAILSASNPLLGDPMLGDENAYQFILVTDQTTYPFETLGPQFVGRPCILPRRPSERSLCLTENDMARRSLINDGVIVHVHESYIAP